MVLTPQEEAMLIEKYSKVVWNTVHRFKRRTSSKRDNREDLYQEGIIVLLKHFRSSKTEEELHRIPIRDMINAMCVYILGEQVVSVPKRTSSFTKTMDSIATAVDYSEMDTDNRYSDNTIEDALQNAMFSRFVDSLSAEERRIIDMKLQGYTNREVAAHLGLTDVMVCRRLKRMKAVYYGNAA